MERTQTQSQNQRGRVVLLNALPLNALPRRNLTLHVIPMNPQDLRQDLRFEGANIIHFIRHAATLNLLRTLIPSLPSEPNAGLYNWREGDIIIVITLNAPSRGTEVQQIRLEDLAVWLVEVEAQAH